MPGINLPQIIADNLLAMAKRKVDDTQWRFPYTGGKSIIPLASLDGREDFFLDLYRGRINLAKNTFQNRARRSVILARLDVDGPPHRNPDDAEIPAPHLHIYREGYGDKWAVPVPLDLFPNLGSTDLSLLDFMRFINVTDPPNIRRELLK